MKIGKVLVTGGSGLLGIEIAKTLSEAGINVLATYNSSKPNKSIPHVEFIPLDILDSSQLMHEIEKCSHVVHCAAIVSFSRYRKKEIFATNVLGTKNLVDCLLAFKDKKLIHISSVAALGRNEGNLIGENAMWSDGYPHTYYAKTKRLSELEVFRGMEEGLKATILNPSVILAPPLENRSSSKIINYVKKGALFYPKGFLNAVDARDVAKAVLKSLTIETGESRITLNGFKISYKDFFEKAAKRYGQKAPSLPTNKFINTLVWLADSLICIFTKKEPLITKETLQLSKKDIVYECENIKLLGIKTNGMDETLDWCCK